MFVGMNILSAAQMTEGKISYSMKIASDILEIPQETKTIVYFAPGKLREEIHMEAAGIVTKIVDKKAGKTLTLTDMMGQKIAVEEDITVPSEPDDTHYKVELMDEEKDIIGYRCKKAIVTNEKFGVAMTMWYTNDIQVPEKSVNYYNAQMPGFPMYFTITQNGMTIEMTVTSIETTVDISKFDSSIPEGYKKQTLEESQIGEEMEGE